MQMFKKFTQQSVSFKISSSMDHLAGGPKKSSKMFPKWLKKLPRSVSNEQIENGLTVKSCVPFIEAMSHGATFSLWCDLRVVVREQFIPIDENGDEFFPVTPIMDYPTGSFDKEKAKGQTIIDELGKLHTVSDFRSDGLGSLFMFPSGLWSNFVETHHRYQVAGFKGRYGCPSNVWKINSPWLIDTPRGYSTFFKNPCNKFDSPLTVFEGFVDTDYYTNNLINFPCFWNDAEEGVFTVERGTPICQMLFIKRDTDLCIEFETIDDADMVEKIKTGHSVLHGKFSDRYRKLFWHKSVESKKR